MQQTLPFDLGPQRSPATVPQIEAQTRQLRRELPPAQPHSPTSQAAATQIAPDANRLRLVVLEWLRQQPEGATDEQMQLGIPMPANTQRPRRRELELRKLIRDSGQTRLTRSGRKALVWIVNDTK